MTTPEANNRDRALKCLALLMEIIRDETGSTNRLEFNGNLAALRKLPADRSVAAIARASLWYAQHRTTQRTPAMLAEDGRHWHLDDEPTEPGVILPPPWKPPPPPANPVTPERLREIRQQATRKDH